jgi:hypothetical protein
LDFFAATHRGYALSFGVTHRRHVVFVKPYYWLIYDRIWTQQPGLRLDWFFHSPLALVATADGWRSAEGPGFSLVAASATRYERRNGMGPADLEGLPDEPAHRQINWVSFCWKAAGGSDPDEIAVLICPGQETVHLARMDIRPNPSDPPFLRGKRGEALPSLPSQGREELALSRHPELVEGLSKGGWGDERGSTAAARFLVETAAFRHELFVGYNYAAWRPARPEAV